MGGSTKAKSWEHAITEHECSLCKVVGVAERRSGPHHCRRGCTTRKFLGRNQLHCRHDQEIAKETGLLF